MRHLVRKKTGTAAYQIEVRFEHGDADFNTTEKYSAAGEKELIELHDRFVKLANALWHCSEPYAKTVELDLAGDEAAIALLHELPLDARYEGSYYTARIVGLKLLVNGIEMEIQDTERTSKEI